MKQIFLVQTNAVEGREDEFNDWYSNVHLPDVMEVPGFIAAQRFRISEAQRDGTGDYPYRYIAIYEMEGDPEAAFKALDSAVAGGMEVTSALAQLRDGHCFEAITERIESTS